MFINLSGFKDRKGFKGMAAMTVYSLRYSRQHPESWGLPRHFQVFHLNSPVSTVLQNAAVHLDVSAFPQCLMKTHMENPSGGSEPTGGRDIGGKNHQKFCYIKL